MILELDSVAIGEGPGAPLPPVSAIAEPGRPGVIAVETEQSPLIASLVAGGRMRPDAGRVLIDGAEDAARIRRAVALVDTPTVAEPFPVMSVRRVVREELAFSGRRPTRHAVDTVLEEFNLTEYAKVHIQFVPTEDRIRLLTELALLRPGVEGLVITSPERHGGSITRWYDVIRSVAERGITVLLITSQASAEVIAPLLPAIDAAPAHRDTTLETASQENRS